MLSRSLDHMHTCVRMAWPDGPRPYAYLCVYGMARWASWRAVMVAHGRGSGAKAWRGEGVCVDCCGGNLWIEAAGGGAWLDPTRPELAYDLT